MLKFNDIKQEPFKFNINGYDNLNFFGFVFKKSGDFFCKGTITGEINLFCDFCGKEIKQNLEINVDLILSDGIYKKSDTLDVFECFNGEIDLEGIFNSEVQSFKSDYNYCKDCQNLKEGE